MSNEPVQVPAEAIPTFTDEEIAAAVEATPGTPPPDLTGWDDPAADPDEPDVVDEPAWDEERWA